MSDAKLTKPLYKTGANPGYTPSDEDRFHRNHVPGIEIKIARYIEQGMTVREAIYKAKPPGFMQDQLIEKYERLFRY